MNLQIVKTATDEHAEQMLEREALWLRELEEVPELDGQVPRLVEEGRHEGRRYIVVSVVPELVRRGETRAFTPDHERFLATLGRARFRTADFEVSGCCQWLQHSVREAEDRLSPAQTGTLRAAYHECETALLYWTGPYVLSQGDFAPWNIRAFGAQLFVTEWGNARAEASPLDDVLHYLMVQRALCAQPLDAPMLQSAMKRAQEFAVQAYPGWSWRAPVIGALTLVYLMGAVLRHPNPAYWNLIETRSAWMPAAS